MIIVSTQCFPPNTGGIENLVYNIALHLSKKGHEVKVFADSTGGRDKGFDKQQPFEVLRYSGLKPLRRRRKAGSVNDWINRDDCKALITDSWKSLEYINPNQQIPLLCLSYGTELPVDPGRKKSKRIRSSFSKASTVVAISRYTASRLEPYINDRKKIQIINPGLNRPAEPGDSTMSLVSSKLSGYGHRLISVGRLEKRKGFDTVVRLLPELLNRYPDLVYIVIGEGSQKHTLEDIANILGVGDNVMILGYQDTESRNAWIKNSDIFVLPARQENDDVEGFGIAFIEAGWFGLPSVAGDTGGAKEAVIQNETGLVCPGDEPESVLRCLRQLIDDSELRSRLGQRARQRAASLLWNHVIEHYIDLIERKD